jgi:CheY-like chemotaxis protein
MTRVLLVDDEPELLEAWSFALAYVGHEVQCARSGREALNLFEQQAPDLLITDLMMPGMNGEDLSRAVRANPQWATVPILLHSSAHIAESDPTAPWDAFLRKPARMDVFLSTVSRLIDAH